MQQKPVIERAFELARSGECQGISDIRDRLRAERYSIVEEALFGRSLQRQLRTLCEQANPNTSPRERRHRRKPS